MKKIILIAFLLTVTPLMATPFNGSYVGLFVGGTMRNGDFQMTPISQDMKQIMSPYSKDYRKSGFQGGFYLGYGDLNNNTYLGIEGSVHYDSANGWQNHSIDLKNMIDIRTGRPIQVKYNFKTQYKKEVVFGLSGRIGTTINKECLLYIKPGIELSKDKLTVKSISMEGSAGQASLSDTGSVSKWKMKLAPGIGAEYAFTPNLSTRIEYVCSFGLGKNKEAKIGGETWEEASHISHAIKIGLSYKFT